MKARIYSTPTCQHCGEVKEFLKEKGVEYEEIDVSADSAAKDDLVKRSGKRAVPQIEINGKFILGLDKKAIEEELKNA